MAAECLGKCPWIQAARNNHTLSNPAIIAFEGFASPFASNEMADEIYRAAVEDSEKCPGPVEEPVLVRRGLPWNRRTVREIRPRCGLDPQPAAEPTPEPAKVAV